jgi:hypothetical protein
MNHGLAMAIPLLGLTAALTTAVAPGVAVAADPLIPDLVELTSGNSVYRADLLGFSEDQSWLVDGVETLFSDLYFLNLVGNPTRRYLRLEDLSPVAFSQPASDRLSATFLTLGGNLSFSLESVLLGGASGSYESARQDTVTLTNTSSTQLAVSLIKYLDYDLQFDDILNNDTGLFANNRFTQVDPSGALATLALDQIPTAVQVSPYRPLLAQLYNTARPLQNRPGPLVNQDATAGLQFDRTLAPGESVAFRFLMTVQRQVKAKAVPEPGTTFALTVAAAGLALLSRRR